MENSIVGREKEITELKKYLSSEQSEFIAVYGRRRVGKTFLIKELLEEQFCFRMTGKENARFGEQLLNFSYALSDFFDDNRVPKNWKHVNSYAHITRLAKRRRMSNLFHRHNVEKSTRNSSDASSREMNRSPSGKVNHSE